MTPPSKPVSSSSAGAWAASGRRLRIAEAGFPVDLFSLFEVKRSHSVCAQGGINACLDTKGEHDSVWQHIVDTLKGGEYLANQPPVKSMCEDAPGLIRTFERMGVTFSRTPEGLLDQRLFGGVKKRRTCFAGASTGQQLLHGVDQQVRRLEDLGLVAKHEWWEFLSLVLDADGAARGIVAMDLREPGGPRLPRRRRGPGHRRHRARSMPPRPPAPPTPPGPPPAAAYQQGAWFANAEFFQFHPTAMLGNDKNRLMSEAARGEGGRDLGPAHPGRHPPAAVASRRPSASTSWRSSSPPTATPWPGTRPRGPSGG